MGTLRHLAKLDNPEEYTKFKNEAVIYYAKESLDGSHWDIAMALRALYCDEFVCASVPSKTWYQFREHKWEEIEEGIFLRQRISDTIVKHYCDMGAKVLVDLSNVTDKPQQAMHSVKLKQIRKLICNLKSAPYKNNIMKEAMEVFYDRRFKAKLDQNPYLIGFKNGIYDLKSNIFRCGYPEDFVSKCMPIGIQRI